MNEPPTLGLHACKTGKSWFYAITSDRSLRVGDHGAPVRQSPCRGFPFRASFCGEAVWCVKDFSRLALSFRWFSHLFSLVFTFKALPRSTISVRVPEASVVGGGMNAWLLFPLFLAFLFVGVSGVVAAPITVNEDSGPTYDSHPSAAEVEVGGEGRTWMAWHAYHRSRDRVLAREIRPGSLGPVHAPQNKSQSGLFSHFPALLRLFRLALPTSCGENQASA